jgi:hypothetical protein
MSATGVVKSASTDSLYDFRESGPVPGSASARVHFPPVPSESEVKQLDPAALKECVDRSIRTLLAYGRDVMEWDCSRVPAYRDLNGQLGAWMTFAGKHISPQFVTDSILPKITQSGIWSATAKPPLPSAEVRSYFKEAQAELQRVKLKATALGVEASTQEGGAIGLKQQKELKQYQARTDFWDAEVQRYESLYPPTNLRGTKRLIAEIRKELVELSQLKVVPVDQPEISADKKKYLPAAASTAPKAAGAAALEAPPTTAAAAAAPVAAPTQRTKERGASSHQTHKHQ